MPTIPNFIERILGRAELPPTARRLLDVGGSHALFSLGFCRRYPQLSATVFDLREALESARQTIAEHGMGDRMSTQVGDMTADDFGKDWDTLLLFNVVHYFDAAQNRALLHKAGAALRPGGSVLILEQLADRAPLPTQRRSSACCRCSTSRGWAGASTARTRLAGGCVRRGSRRRGGSRYGECRGRIC